ncbi:hypothetical protein A9Q77_07740, partial [Marinomonas sp. 42_23_T18]
DSGHEGVISISTGDKVFNSISFEAVEYASDSTSTNDSSDYYITAIEGNGPASANTQYQVTEDGILTIETSSVFDLLDNDSDAQNDSFNITHINGTNITDGQEIILDSGAKLTIGVNGNFEYDPNSVYDALEAGEVTTDTYTYTITDEHGATDTATATITIIGKGEAPVITDSEVVVSEEGLTNGIVDTDGSPTDETNATSVSGVVGITDDGNSLSVTLLAPSETLSSDGVTITWAGNDTQELVGQANGVDVIRVTINDAGAYNVELLKPVDHPTNSVEDIFTLNFGVKADDGSESTTGKITVNIEDDMPTSSAITRELDVGPSLIVVKNLEAGFKDSVFDNGTSTVNTENTDSDSLTDKIEWGTAANNSDGQSGYNLIDNSNFTSTDGSEVNTTDAFKLADFTHQNWAINSNSSTLDKTTITMSMDVEINGETVAIDFDVLVEHTETPNSGDANASRDIVTLPAGDITKEINGQEYTFKLEGFKDANGDFVKTIYTNESANNTYEIFASIESNSDLPHVEGVVTLDAGADGFDRVDWGSLDNPYGTMTANANGEYNFVVNQGTYDSLTLGETVTQSFTYTVVDKDGDGSTNTVSIEITGTNTPPEALDRHIDMDTATEVTFTMTNFVSDVEDDSNSTIVKIRIESLPEDGVLTVNGTPVAIGDEYDEIAQIKYTANENLSDTLYGTTEDTGTLTQWGTITNGELTTDDGKATITAFADGQAVGFASENDNNNHDGLGIGVDSDAGDDDQIDKTNDEKIVISFASLVSNAEFGLASLGGHFTPGATENAQAHWVAYKDGIEVSSGDVKQSTDDSNATTNTFTVEADFDRIEFTTVSDATNSNYSIQYMNVDYKVDDSFDYIAIDSLGLESEVATVTIDMDTVTSIEVAATYEAFAYNGDNFMSGNFNNPGSINLNSVNETAITAELGVGIQNNQNESETGIDDNETLLLKLSEDVSSATFNINVNSNDVYSGGWVAFDNNGDAISTGRFNDQVGNLSLSISDIGSFSYIAFDAHTSNGNASDIGFYVEPVSYVNLDGKSVEFDNSTEAMDIVGDLRTDITTGFGDDTINVMDSGSDIESSAQVATGAGDDVINVEDDIDGSANVNTGSGDDTIKVGGKIEDSASVDMGEGQDTLALTYGDDSGEDDTIDLTQIANRVDNVEIIDLDNNVDQKVAIDWQDIVDLTDGDNDLVFVGNDGDVIDFSDNSDWQLNGNETKKVDGVDGDFKEYVSTSNSSVSIFIEDDIDVEDF